MKYGLLIVILFFAIAGCSKSANNAKSFYEQGIALAVDGEFDNAQEAFTKALQDKADRGAAQQSLEVIKGYLSQRFDTQAAIDFFKGIRAGNKGEEALAYSHFSKSIKSAPDFASAYYERGIINGRLKLYDQAIEDFSRTIELDPLDSAAYHNRGLARAKGLKEYNQAISDFTEALKLDPQLAEAYDNRGIAYRMAGDNAEKACADWKKSCDLDRCNSYHLARQNGYCQ